MRVKRLRWCARMRWLGSLVRNLGTLMRNRRSGPAPCFAIEWKGRYWIEGPAFVYADHDTGRVTNG